MKAGNIIRSIRKNLKLTQKDFGELIGAKIKSIHAYEKLGQNPPVERFLNILRLCPDDRQLIDYIRDISHTQAKISLEDRFCIKTVVLSIEKYEPNQPKERKP